MRPSSFPPHTYKPAANHAQNRAVTFLIVLMLQCIFMPSAFAVSTQRLVALPPQQLLRAGVSVVRLVVTYTSTSASLPAAPAQFQCTGLGVIVASWAPTSSSDLTPNTLIVTDGNLLENENNTAKCVPPSLSTGVSKLTLASITVYFSNTFSNNFNGRQALSVTSPAPVDVRCKDTTACGNSVAIFTMYTSFANPFVSLAGATDPAQGQGIELANSASTPSVTLKPSIAVTKQDPGYTKTFTGKNNFLTPGLYTSTTPGEAGMPIVNVDGKLISLLLANATTPVTLQDLSAFVISQKEWQHQQPETTNVVKMNWDKGITAFYNGKASFPEANTAFNTAVKANPQFQGAQQLANDTQNAPPPQQNITLPFIGSFPAFWLRFLLVGGGVLVVVIVLLVVFLFLRRPRRTLDYQELEELPATERVQQESIGQTSRPQPLILGKGPPLFQTQLPQEQSNIPFSDKTNITTPPVRQQVTKLPCPVCGTSVVSTARWCPNCGTSLMLADSGLRMVVQPSQSPKPAPAVEKKPNSSFPVEEKPTPLPSVQVPTPSFLEQKVEKKVVVPTSSAEQQSALIKVQEKSEPKNNIRAENRAGKRLGNYRLMRLIGYGAFADVYLGEHIYLETQAAIKVLRKRLGAEDVERFLNEAKTVARFEHPHIVRILEFGQESNEFGVEQNAVGVDGRIPFLVMEYAPGGTLRNRHPKGSILPLSTIIPYVNQVADALQYAHDKKLIHRDVKPENILIANNNRLLLSDFGVVAIAHTDGSMTTQDMIGTVPYMSPEQFKGKPRPASDQYALAIVVYEWLCGHTPYQGAPIEVAMQHITAALPSLRSSAPSVSPAVEAIIAKALAKDPSQRFESVLAFARALEQAR